MAKEERLYSSKDSAYATRLSLASFRAKVRKLGIKGTRKGVQVCYTHAQLEDIYNDKATKTVKGLPVKKAKAKKATARRVERKERAKR
jgi:hypothetical protein